MPPRARRIKQLIDSPRPAIRPARATDAPAFVHLLAQLGYPAVLDPTRNHLARLLRDRRNGVFVAEVRTRTSRRLVGLIHVESRTALTFGRYAEIDALVVDDSRRRAGIGAALVARASAWSIEHGLLRVRVRSATHRRATHRFYRALGFSVTKRQVIFDCSVGDRSPSTRQ